MPGERAFRGDECTVMTLNITVASARAIYQSADYRLFDWQTKRYADFETQKIVYVGKGKWSATVSFAGVGRTRTLNVGGWLDERVSSVSHMEPFDRLLEELLSAEEWLKDVEHPNNKHTFSVAAFLQGIPTLAVVSNWESLSESRLGVATKALRLSQVRPTEPIVFVAGQVDAVSPATRRRLKSMVRRDISHDVVERELYRINREVASARSSVVSPSCYTTHLRDTGTDNATFHDPQGRKLSPLHVLPRWARHDIATALARLGIEGSATRFPLMRSVHTELEHQAQLRDKPNDSNSYSNYGIFLETQKKDIEGAEALYLQALKLNERNVTALGNLANIRWNSGNTDEAEVLYKKAASIQNWDRHVALNYSSYLLGVRDDSDGALRVLDTALVTRHDDPRLHHARGSVLHHQTRFREALSAFELARGDVEIQAAVEAAYAITLHQSGAPIGQCLAAYQVAVALNPEHAALRLNMAQLLFVQGDETAAKNQLQEAWRLGLDAGAQIEAHFYALCHTQIAPHTIQHSLTSLLSKDAKLRWDVDANIESVKRDHSEKAATLEKLRLVLTGERALSELPNLLKRLSSR